MEKENFKNTTSKTKQIQDKVVSKLSKAGLWLKNNPDGVFVIKDLRAVMQ
ncbi:MAG: hypothetical protein LBN95_12430 [Prevotellaceae bacterium]|jgi:hypothetical protein|nr:hypothetical protein [Prevotellaceae bacterium]